MKKVVALCLCIVSLFVSIPVYAAECDDTSEGRMYTVAELIPAEDGSATIVPYNVDLMPVSGPYWQNYVSVSKGKNMKVHVYIESFGGGANTVQIYVKPNSAAGALNDKYKVATWTGTGHHWADLALNTKYTKYYVILWGAFNGSGAVYTEP